MSRSQPYRLHIHSPLFVVAGLVSIRFKLPSPPQALAILNVQATIEQHWHLISRTNKDKRTGAPYEERPPPDRLMVALIDANRPPDAIGAVAMDGTICDGISPAIAGKRDAKLSRLDIGESWEITHVARLRAWTTVSLGRDDLTDLGMQPTTTFCDRRPILTPRPASDFRMS